LVDDAAFQLLLHLVQCHGEERRERFFRCEAMGEILGFQMAVGSVTALGPAHEQQRRAVPTGGIRVVVRQR